jgi:hypothetical protein|tara:strand:- start:10174 stop:10794 length:621 start_codon:yes stop_codon:yes gene_type:complete
MYQLEDLDVNRFVHLLRKQRYKSHWEDYWQNLYDQMQPTEFKIQKWWGSKVDLIGKSVSILNSGVGFYSVPMCFEKGASRVTTYDMCPITSEIAWEANSVYNNYNHKVLDVVFDNHVFTENRDRVYINTSCEHSYPMKDIIPNNVEVVLSGNDLTKRGHINKINSISELADQAGVTEIIFEDEIVFDYHDELGPRHYKQFLIYGKK